MQEEWKDIYFYCNQRHQLFDYRGYYQVSNYGRVRSIDRADKKNHSRKGIVLKQKKTKRPCGKYDLRINLSKYSTKETFLVSRLVGYMFLENDDPENKIQINHIDENPENNHITNLEWCTCEYNINYGTRAERWKDSREGWKHSDESKEKIKLATQGENNPMYGKHHTQETKDKLMIDKGTKIIAINIDNPNDKLYFDSIRDAHRKGFDRSCISQCLNPLGNQSKHKGYKWYNLTMKKI